MVDARYERIRRNGAVISQGVLVVVGIDDKGYREVLDVWSEGWVSYLVDDYHINDFAFEGDLIWCATVTGLVRYDTTTGEERRYTTDDGLLSNIVTDIVVDWNGIKWMATLEGVSRFDGETWVSFGKEEIFKGYKINDITADMRGMMWFTTDHGVFKYDGVEWQFIDMVTVTKTHNDWVWDVDYHFNDIKSSAMDSLGVVWFGTDEHGLFNYDGEAWHAFIDVTDDSLSRGIDFEDENVKYIYVDRNNNVYFCLDNSYVVKIYDDWRFYSSDLWSKYASNSVLVTGQENDIWIGSNYEGMKQGDGEGLANIKDGVIIFYNEENGLPYNTATSLEKNANGILWIGTERGLAYYSEGELHKTALCTIPYTGAVLGNCLRS